MQQLLAFSAIAIAILGPWNADKLVPWHVGVIGTAAAWAIHLFASRWREHPLVRDHRGWPYLVIGMVLAYATDQALKAKVDPLAPLLTSFVVVAGAFSALLLGRPNGVAVDDEEDANLAFEEENRPEDGARLLSKLFYGEGPGPYLVTSDGNAQYVHQRQGTLDGACGVYSVVMALHILGRFSNPNKDFERGSTSSRRTPVRKFVDGVRALGPLVANGSNLSDWISLIEPYASVEVWSATNAEQSRDNRHWLREHAPYDVPIVVSIHNMDDPLHHAVLAIGLETRSDGDWLLILDPGYDICEGAGWNAELRLKSRGGGPQSHEYFVTWPSRPSVPTHVVSIGECLAISKKKRG